MKVYKPSYLYIKIHNKTGLKYFGKTTRDPFKYKGSGKIWNAHLNVHGNDVTTLLLNDGNPYHDENEFIKTALEFSINNNIAESKEWANIRLESGDGGDTSMCEAYIRAIAKRDLSGKNNPRYGKESPMKGKTYEELYGVDKAKELKDLRVLSSSNRKLSQESIDKMRKSISVATKGVPKSAKHRQNMKKPKSEEHKQKLRGPKPRVKCPKCNKEGGISQMKRWHFDKCKTVEVNV